MIYINDIYHVNPVSYTVILTYLLTYLLSISSQTVIDIQFRTNNKTNCAIKAKELIKSGV